MRPSAKGDACEAHVLAALLDANLQVWRPWGDNGPSDLAVEIGGRFLRIQCKTGRLTGNGCLSFNAYRVGRKPLRSRYQPGEFDYYGVWCRHMRTVYLVPFEDAPGWMPYLRLDPPRPGATGGVQGAGIRWADKYEASVVIDGWLRACAAFSPADIASGQPGRA